MQCSNVILHLLDTRKQIQVHSDFNFIILNAQTPEPDENADGHVMVVTRGEGFGTAEATKPIPTVRELLAENDTHIVGVLTKPPEISLV